MPIKIQGREHITYDELLDQATKKGLWNIETTIVQFPSEENGQTTIAHARVIFQDSRSFDGIGDANIRNVSKGIVLHVIRMAETRAKARALRDALNIKGAAAEELGDDAMPDAPTDIKARRLTDAMIRKAQATRRDCGLDAADVEQILADNDLPTGLGQLWTGEQFDSFLKLLEANKKETA